MTQPMLTVSAKDVSSKFGFYSDEALLRPVGVQRHGQTRIVMISLVEYERLLSRDRRAILTRDLDEETLEAIASAQPGARARAAGRKLADT